MWFTNESPALRACWHPVAYRRELDRAGGGPVRVELLGEAWALGLVDGHPMALRDECAHRSAPLSAGEIVDGCFRCPYHGWSYRSDGALVNVPALGPGATLPARAQVDRPAALPEIGDAELTLVPLDPWEWEVSAAQMADNFLDVAHFPFVHTGTFGDPDDLLVAPHDVQRHGWTFDVVHRHSTKALADSADPSAGYTVHERGNHFVFTAPYHVYLRIDYEAEGVVLGPHPSRPHHGRAAAGARRPCRRDRGAPGRATPHHRPVAPPHAAGRDRGRRSQACRPLGGAGVTAVDAAPATERR